MMKVLMRVSRAFRSLQGASDFATLRSVPPTVQKRGLNRITVVMQGSECLLAQLDR